MEQLEFLDVSWKQIVGGVINDVSLDEDLPEKSLQLLENYSVKKNVVTSYSVVVLKPDYPKGINPNGIAKNSLINIKANKTKNNPVETLSVSVPNWLIEGVQERFSDIPLIKKKSDPITRANITTNSNDLKEFFGFVIKSVLDKYFEDGGDAFGCCHLYEQCSDAKKCLHENKLYARGCIYGRNLAEGRIFYGKNRNV